MKAAMSAAANSLELVLYRNRESALRATVVTPVAAKDIASLALCLQNVGNSGIQVTEALIAFGGQLSHEQPPADFPISCVSESTIAERYRLADSIILGGRERRGWLLQQILKLQIASETTDEYVLWLDSDTVFLRRVTYLHKGKIVLYAATEYHREYQEATDRLVPGLQTQSLSYVTHAMLVKTDHVRALLREIARNGQWVQRILECINPHQASGFSEYDLYARYVLSRFPKDYTVAWRLHRDVNDIKLVERRRVPIQTVSCHQRP
jgi:hypothetical protein